VGGLGRPGATCRAATDLQLSELGDELAALAPREGDARDAWQSRRLGAVDVRAIVERQDLALEPLTLLTHVRKVTCGELGICDACGNAHANDGGHVRCACTQTTLLSTARDLRGEGNAETNVERARTLGAVELVRAQREQVNVAELGEVHRHLADGLCGVAQHDRADRVRATGELGDGLNGADLVVGEVRGDEQHAVVEERVERVEIHHAVGRDGCDAQLEAEQLNELIHRATHRAMLDGRAHEHVAHGSDPVGVRNRLHDAANSEVVRLGRTACEERARRVTTDESGHLAAGDVHGCDRGAACGMARVCGIAVEVRQGIRHRRDHARIERSGRCMVEIDGVHDGSFAREMRGEPSANVGGWAWRHPISLEVVATISSIPVGTLPRSVQRCPRTRESTVEAEAILLFRQFHLPQLGHASYLIGDEAAGVAIVVDAQLDSRGYVDAALEAGVKITHALDTHAHSDYLSGRQNVADATGAEVLVSAHGRPADAGQRAFGAGDELQLGSVWVRAVHVPGHAPEQLALFVGTDADRDHPELVLTGGSLLCGDLGRPDIDESVPMSIAAPATVTTVREQLLVLDDSVRVYPTHVAGSLCSAAADGATETTIGHERAANTWLVAGADIDAELARLPRKPGFWTRLRHTNDTAMPVVTVASELRELTPAEALDELGTGSVLLLDARDAEDHAAGHPARAVHMGASASAPVLAGALLDPHAVTLVLADDAASALRLGHDLQRSGIDAPTGWVCANLDAWRAAGGDIDTIAIVEADELLARGGDARLLDVRQPAEWARDGYIDGSVLLSLSDLPELGSDLPSGPLVVACAAGRRSITAVSTLRYLGREGDVSVAGGVGEWTRVTANSSSAAN